MFSYILKKRSWWEHPVVDLWTIPHALSGTILAYALLWLGVGLWVGLGVSIIVAVLWEVFEKITHLSDVEHHTNGVSDVVAAQVGYGVGVWVFSAYAGTGADTAALAIAGVIFVGMCILGWLSHYWYGKK